MSSNQNKMDVLCSNTIRCLSIDAVQKANSGHPGITMGCAPIAHTLYSKVMKHNPKNSSWKNRDRFILSAGHGSMLLYSILHLSGYDLSIDEIKNFRQWNSLTPGHPEFGKTDGVETTTGPLGQGFANGIGMALAYSHLAARFNKEDLKILDHYIYAIVSDGEMMEGISHESASFAGHNKLGNIIYFYDDNKITIDGSTELSMSDDTIKRFEAYGWHVQTITDGNDFDGIHEAVKNAQDEKEKPSLIITQTKIGYGSPNKEGSESSHGAPLGEDEVKLTKEYYGFPIDKDFYVPEEVKEYYSEVISKGEKLEEEWNSLFEEYKKKYPKEAELFEKIFDEESDFDIERIIEEIEMGGKPLATRASSGKVINTISEKLPNLIGGSADLTPSNNTLIKNDKAFSGNSHEAKNIHFGIREHAMASMMNGMCLYGGLRPYGGTFLVFLDYMRPAVRLASLCGLNPIYIFTHDSIGLGEDGPTHQPIEHLASLRAIPGVKVIRPGDSNETKYAWVLALRSKNNPVALALTRQKLEEIDRNKYGSAEGVLKGAYILKETENEPDLILIATGSEVNLALETAEKLETENINIRVVSMPSWEVFEEQSEEYKNSVLPKRITKRISIEAGISQGWEKYIGCEGKSICMSDFGASAPYSILFDKFGFSVERIEKEVKKLLG